ncbi:unnamed protein product [Closterium sp. NIES-65]|nr:unnamed protein product [Closterium sp. NIES-65]
MAPVPQPQPPGGSRKQPHGQLSAFSSMHHACIPHHCPSARFSFRSSIKTRPLVAAQGTAHRPSLLQVKPPPGESPQVNLSVAHPSTLHSCPRSLSLLSLAFASLLITLLFLPYHTSVLSPSSSLPLSVLSRPSGSLTWERQWRGTWNRVHRQQLLSTTTQPQLTLSGLQTRSHFSSVLSLLVVGRGVGVNTTAPSRSSPVAVQVAVVGGEGGSTPLGCGGKGEYRAGSSETRWVGGRGVGVNTATPSHLSPVAVQVAVVGGLRVGALKQGQESEVHPLTHLLLSPFSLPSQQHPTWTTVESPPSVHPPLPSITPSPAA